MYAKKSCIANGMVVLNKLLQLGKQDCLRLHFITLGAGAATANRGEGCQPQEPGLWQ